MKKKLFTSLAFLSLVVTGCNETQHSHNYEVNGEEAWTWVAGEDVAWKSATVTFTCSGCDESAQGHSFTLGVSVTSEITLAPTCEASGTKVYTASVEFEGKTYTNTKEETLPAIGHKALEGWSYDQNTHWHGCEHEMCQSKLDEASHSLKATWSSDDSKHWHECEICDYKADLADHVFNQNIQTKDTLMKAADCTHDAVFYKSCTCGAISKTETFVAEGTALGHDMTKHDAVAPTCEKNGNLEYYTCSREPGVYYKDKNGINTFADITEIVVGALGHKASEDWSYDSKNHWHDCEHEGCEEHISEEAHNFKETWSLDETQHWHECEVCEYKVDIANHTFDQKVKNDKTLKSAADCTHDAVYYKSCVCGKISTTETFADEGSALGHDMTKHELVAPKYNSNGIKEYYTCSREEGIYFADKNGTETYTEEELVILPEDWIFGPGDEFGFTWDFSGRYSCESENLPFTFTTAGFHGGENCISADVPPEGDDSDGNSYMYFEMNPFYPNAIYGEEGEYIGHKGDQLCMLKASKIILYMAYQPWEYIGKVSINDELDYSVEDAYDFDTQSYTIDVSELTKSCDYLNFEIYFALSFHHASAFPDPGKELQTFGVELVGELVAYEGTIEE